MGKMQRIRSQLSCDLPMTRKKLQQRKDGAPKKPGRISVNVDVLELGPIELEVCVAAHDGLRCQGIVVNIVSCRSKQ